MTKEQKIALIILYMSFISTKIYDLFNLTKIAHYKIKIYKIKI